MGTATFEFFDDFESSALDGSKWGVSGGSWSVVNDTQQDGSAGGVVEGSIGSSVRRNPTLFIRGC